MMRVAVITPTYNEAGGIEAVLNDLVRTFRTHPTYEWLVVVVDANSPDGTADIVRAFASAHPNVHLLVEEGKQGIGAAYCAGFRHAMHELHADVIVSFDGDGQHNCEDVPRLVGKIAEGNDYVIGSRYVAGGSIPGEWAWHRKFLSRFGSLYARILLRLPVHDVTSGFRAMRVKGYAEHLTLDPAQLLSRQYAYIFQFLPEMQSLQARILEIPIAFRMRENDSSKSTWKDILESLRVTTALFFNPPRRLPSRVSPASNNS